jgi:hypothetical protein
MIYYELENKKIKRLQNKRREKIVQQSLLVKICEARCRDVRFP